MFPQEISGLFAIGQKPIIRGFRDIHRDPPRFILAAGRRSEIIFDASAKAAAELRCSALVHWN